MYLKIHHRPVYANISVINKNSKIKYRNGKSRAVLDNEKSEAVYMECLDKLLDWNKMKEPSRW